MLLELCCSKSYVGHVYGNTEYTEGDHIMSYSAAVAKAMLVTWAGYGVTIEKYNTVDGKLTFYISVPERSKFEDVNKNELSGQFLSTAFRRALSDMGMVDAVLKARIRQGDYWDSAKQDGAKVNMEQFLNNYMNNEGCI